VQRLEPAGRHRVGFAVAVVLTYALSTGCGSPSPTLDSGTVTSTASAAVTPPASRAPSTIATVPAAARAARAVPLTVSMRKLRQGSQGLSWDIEIPVFSGGSVAEKVNSRVLASAYDGILKARQEVREGDPERTLSGHSTVTTNDGRTVQVVLEFSDNLPETAHPKLFRQYRRVGRPRRMARDAGPSVPE
jgi:hypothetical protein